MSLLPMKLSSIFFPLTETQRKKSVKKNINKLTQEKDGYMSPTHREKMQLKKIFKKNSVFKEKRRSYI